MAYTVREVAEATGVPQATLRAWERRYGVVVPGRSGNGYRDYSEADVGTLRRMAALVAQGARPAVAAVLARRSHTPQGSSAPPQDLLAMTAAMDSAGMLDALGRQHEALGLGRMLDEWLLPQMAEVGRAWASRSITVAHEHHASEVVVRWLHGTMEALRQPAGPVVLLGLPPRNRHELGLLGFAALLRSQGLRVVYLGSDVPRDAWPAAARLVQPRAVVTAAARPCDARAVDQLAEALEASGLDAAVLAGGGAAALCERAEALPDSLVAASELLQGRLAAGMA